MTRFAPPFLRKGVKASTLYPSPESRVPSPESRVPSPESRSQSIPSFFSLYRNARKVMPSFFAAAVLL
jgi:hypothetical protein